MGKKPEVRDDGLVVLGRPGVYVLDEAWNIAENDALLNDMVWFFCTKSDTIDLTGRELTKDRLQSRSQYKDCDHSPYVGCQPLLAVPVRKVYHVSTLGVGMLPQFLKDVGISYKISVGHYRFNSDIDQHFEVRP